MELSLPNPCFIAHVTNSSSYAKQQQQSSGGIVKEVDDRIGSVKRVTNETNVEVELNLDGVGTPDSNTGIPFLDHMLDQLASHGLFDVHVKAVGDIHIDDHHTNEDVALAIGTALLNALGDRKGINRFGDFTAPLDEALVHVTLDLSGRPHLSYDLQIPTERVGTYDTQLVEHFFQSVVNTSGMTLHIRQLAGKNSHHIIEATFKAFARALRQATEYDPRRRGTVPSSKGVLSRS
nr:imidazoleglycerol-phosphate dehydratase [Tanacetum cinerariifolium]